MADGRRRRSNNRVCNGWCRMLHSLNVLNLESGATDCMWWIAYWIENPNLCWCRTLPTLQWPTKEEANTDRHSLYQPFYIIISCSCKMLHTHGYTSIWRRHIESSRKDKVRCDYLLGIAFLLYQFLFWTSRLVQKDRFSSLFTFFGQRLLREALASTCRICKLGTIYCWWRDAKILLKDIDLPLGVVGDRIYFELDMRKVYSILPGISETYFPSDLKVSLELSHEVSCLPRQSLAGGGE